MKKKFLIPIVVSLVVAVTWGVIACVPPAKQAENSWLAGENGTLISAHRGGSDLNPENTLMAFTYCLDTLGYVDCIELDIRTSSDGECVIIHDDTINRVALPADAEPVSVSSLSLSQLRQVNLAYNFTNDNGEYPYRELSQNELSQKGLTISTLKEFLDRFSGYDFRVLIEIKEKGQVGINAVEKVISLLSRSEYASYQGKYMIISFDNDVIDSVADNHPEIARGPLGTKVQSFVITYMLGLNSLDKPNYNCIQLPISYKVGALNISLAKKGLVDKLHSRNMAITYWTIDSEDDMCRLVDIGADIITTNRPDTLYSILKARGLRK